MLSLTISVTVAISFYDKVMRSYSKKDYPVGNIRRILEPGPVVMVSSSYKGETNIMTMAWYTVMEFYPSLIGCVIASSNYSFELIRKSKECVINVPTVDLVDQVIGVGNCSGAEVDKFSRFGFTAAAAASVQAPLIKECFANFECKISDTKLINSYNFFIFEVVKAHVAVSPKYPKTLHYRGQGVFTVSGESMNMSRKFTKLKNLPNF